MMIPSIMFAIKEPCRGRNDCQSCGAYHILSLIKWMTTNWQINEEMWKTYRSEDHVKWHCNVEVESIVVYDTHSEEHGHHYHIVSTEDKNTKGEHVTYLLSTPILLLEYLACSDHLIHTQLLILKDHLKWFPYALLHWCNCLSGVLFS